MYSKKALFYASQSSDFIKSYMLLLRGVDNVAEYCDGCVCLSACLSVACISQIPRTDHAAPSVAVDRIHANIYTYYYQYSITPHSFIPALKRSFSEKSFPP